MNSRLILLLLTALIMAVFAFTDTIPLLRAHFPSKNTSKTSPSVMIVSTTPKTTESPIPPDSSRESTLEEKPILIGTSSPKELQPEPSTSTYIDIREGCGPYFEGACLRVHSAPSVDAPVVAKLRTHEVLKVGQTIENEGRTWYKIVFDEWLRYPERVTDDWYVAAEFVTPLEDKESSVSLGSSTKLIVVDRSEQKLYAYEKGELFMATSVSTGLDLTPTPRGIFTIYRKTPSRYMQGPLPDISDQYYDLPGVPWNLYFTNEGGAIHGAYWHDKFGQQWSHGCVNLPPEKAQILYAWAEIGTQVTVRD